MVGQESSAISPIKKNYGPCWCKSISDAEFPWDEFVASGRFLPVDTGTQFELSPKKKKARKVKPKVILVLIIRAPG